MLNKKNVYFLGGGGIGMSALMRYFLAQGKNVAGYDKTQTHLTDQLLEEGADLHFEDEVGNIPSEFQIKEDALVIYTPAIPKDSAQLNYFNNEGYFIFKRSEILGMITEKNYNIAVAGTHGKTTISSMVAHCLKHCNYPMTAFLGGVSKNLRSNYYHDSNSKVTVIEADEYDRSFLKLSPNIISVSAADADHLDIYGTEEEMQNTFRQFLTKNLQKDGSAIIEKKLETILGHNFETYSLNDVSADYYVTNLKIEDSVFLGDFNWNNGVVKNVVVGLPGLHNMENSLVAFAIVQKLGISAKKIKDALAAYSGVERRFDIHIKTKNCVYIDDYAHHPAEIKSLVLSVKKMYPNKKITGVFQPHLFTRTRDFLDGFAKSLELLDTVVLLDIYPARELPIPGIDSELLLSKIKKNSKMLCSKKDMHHYISNTDCDVVLTIGAGDIGMEVVAVKQNLLNRLNINEL
ncbi:MAG: UDP-N-acetylmuramate--alanine ligase [Saprospiraceae bacterium]